ncbi:MAG: flagellar biosynthesis protein FliQ [Butyrivibrio sp.]|uniref:flagellar biosynthesis protein FliQ n=1 Tax=Butyrivibrio sp. TaxID=28121 RepID=UPI0025EA57E6|nr:flagellar biosynthesis protein FliQ [Butyrivibrio sp.]MCR5772267.1 flagellar biosynthesis protein FliQ [Butyrivibrio sp.]
MDAGVVNQIIRDALFLVIKVGGPMLLASLVMGLVISIFQTVTSIQEQTLTFVPKLLVAFLCLILLGNYMGTQISDFMTKLWSDFSLYIH